MYARNAIRNINPEIIAVRKIAALLLLVKKVSFCQYSRSLSSSERSSPSSLAGGLSEPDVFLS
jgi:hypothetical protein